MVYYSLFLIVLLAVAGLISVNEIQAEFTSSQKLVGGNYSGSQPQNVGYAVAISKDGSTAMIAGPSDGDGAGSVWAFERLDNGTWVQQGDKLTIPSSGFFGSMFGESIALSADGTTAVISAPGENSLIGSARFYTRLSNKTWVQQGDKFVGSDRQGGFIGLAVAMDANATTAFVGGSKDNNLKGAVWVVVNDGLGNWTQSGLKLTPNDENGQGTFGTAIAVSDDATTLLIGGPDDNNSQGAAWVFVRLDNGTYVQTQPKLVPSDADSSSEFGSAVALSFDGTTALIGGPNDASALGGIWAYILLENGTFVQQSSKLVPSDVIGTSLIFVGDAVALSSDGYTALVGGAGDNNNVGAVWVFCRYDNGSWIQSGTKLFAADYVSSDPQQGFALAYSSGGSSFISGGPYEDSNIGAAWVFDEVSSTCPGAPTAAPTTSSPTTAVPTTAAPTAFALAKRLVGTAYSSRSSMGFAVAMSKDGSTAMVGGPSDMDGTGAVWSFERKSNGTWVQQGNKLTITRTALSIPQFGNSISLNIDGTVALIGSPGDSKGVGSARFYKLLANKTWVQQGSTFQGTDYQTPGQPQIGRTVTMIPSATVAFVAGPFDNDMKGAVWVVTNDAHGNWTQFGLKLFPSDTTGTRAQFGESFAVSDDGETLLVSGPANSNFKGGAWVFVRLDNGTYVQSQSKLFPSDWVDSSYEFGRTVALSSDGNTALISAQDAPARVWVFTKQANGTFEQQTMQFTPSDSILSSTDSNVFLETFAVALSSDGYTALVGAGADNSETGGVWVFCRYINDTWIQNEKLLSANYVGHPQQGASIAYSSDASRFMIGGPGDDDYNGAAWVFEDVSNLCPGPPTSAPTTFSEIQKLVGTGNVWPSAMGSAVAISRDGTIALIGGPTDTSSRGAVWTFERLVSGTTWSHQQSIPVISGLASYSEFGYSIALSGDGKTAVIGAMGEDSMVGSARFFTRLSNRTWIVQGTKFQGSDRQGLSRTGYAVAMDLKGTTAFVGGPYDNSLKGAVWIVKNDGNGNWKQYGLKLIPKDLGGGTVVSFGISLAVSDDASILLIGGRHDNNFDGAAWIFKRQSTGAYIQAQSKMVPRDAADSAQVGSAVSLSSDGATALIGAVDDSSNTGACWVYTKLANGTFVQQTNKLVPSDIVGMPNFVGGAVALSRDGRTALVSGYGDDSNKGAVWTFCRLENDSWIQSGSKLIAPDAIGPAELGFSVAFASEASLFIAGGRADNSTTGAAWVFDATSASCATFTPTKSPTRTPTVYCTLKCRKACRVAKKCPRTCPRSCIPTTG